LLVARLHAEGVPVAGVDRLLLSAPLAVQDLLAAARFAVQPLDDLNLSSLLVSPLFGWSQDQLHAVAAGRKQVPLWQALRARGAVLEGLSAILDMADYASPHLFFETLLSGPFDGRRKLIERLGAEARDPIEELLSAALEFEGTGASLQAFLDWFARGDVEVVRDPSGPQGAVRVMTVHGAKGLQSPVLILADACADPDRKPPGLSVIDLELGEGASVPVFRPKKEELAEPLLSRVAARDKLDREEHWRLLYVALTRAEERLYVGGALTQRDRNGAPLQSWHRAVETALTGLGEDWAECAHWTREIRFGPPPVPRKAAVPEARAAAAVPDWLRRAAPVEARPPRPLAPSAIEDEAPNPPPGPELRAAAERGRLLHQLFERLPGVAPDQRRELADRWLEHSAGVVAAAGRAALIDAACRVIDDPAFAELFGPEALAEAPVAAVIADGVVVAGKVDRLLVADTHVLVADFKTGRRTPAGLDDIPPSHLRQMAAYRAALRVIFPDRPVRAALLYTAAPVLHALPDDLLDAHLPAGA
jgi:ATP-dependent helicase/nuclease subunit A